MTPVFCLTYDDQFIGPSGDGRILVYFYQNYANDVSGTNACSSSAHWGYSAFCGPASNACSALKVFGTIIEGDRFQLLYDELSAIKKGRAGLSVLVNRLGQYLIFTEVDDVFDRSYMDTVRINDRFDWSKYGVKSPQDIAEEANKETRRSLEEKNVELAACKKELEEKSAALKECKEELERMKKEHLLSQEEEVANKKLRRSFEDESTELKACRKEVEEKSMELAACKKELEWSKKNESLWSKLVEEKEKVNEMMKNRILALEADP